MRRKLIAIVIVTLLVLTTIAALLAYNTTNKGSEKLQVVTTFYPLYYFSSQIAGDRADVHMLIPDNSEPHSWQPRPSDMVRVDKSDVIIYNGAGFEPWIEDFLAQVSNPDLLIVDTSQGISMLLSDEVKEQFESAEEVVLNGPVVEVEASNSLEGTELVEAVTSHIVVNMSLLNGSVGMVRINISEPGDYRLFMLSDVDFELLTPEREQPEIELQVLGPSEFPEFVNTVFYGLEDGPTGEYVLELTSSDHNPVEFVILRWEEEGEGHDHHDHAALDPHFWLDPLTAKVQVARIAQAFCSADPVNATYYNNNADDLRSKLDQLNQDYILGLENRTKNDIITTHEGFSYLAHRYGFSAHGAIGISGDEQPSAQDLANLADLAQGLELRYVYSEPIYSDAVIETIAREAGLEVLVLDGAHGRTGVHAGMDYFEIMYANLEQLRIGLLVTDLE